MPNIITLTCLITSYFSQCKCFGLQCIPLGRVDTTQMDVPHCVVQRLTPGFPRCFASVMWVWAQRDSSHISLSITDKHPRWNRKQICGNHFIISPRVPLRATLTGFHNRLRERICPTLSGKSKDVELSKCRVKNIHTADKYGCHASVYRVSLFTAGLVLLTKTFLLLKINGHWNKILYFKLKTI